MKGFFNPDTKRKMSAKKLFSKKLFRRGGFSALALTVFTSILATPRVAHAGFWDGLVQILIGAMMGVASVVFAIVTLIVSTLVYTIAWISRWLVEFAINLSINFSYTSGPIFNAGWPVLRDLANMGLILILVGIGVGTMLNLRLNKNRLPMFFLVALLINLTPVITGVVIDFSNIIANVFFVSAKNALSAAIGNSPIDFALTQGQNMLDQAANAALSGEFTVAVLGNIVQPILSILIGLALIFVFLLLTALFLGRIVALLILVILSPIAFLGLIFQGGRGRQLWNKWWSTFFQWAIIVIPLIFFIWLGGIFLNAAPQLCDPADSQFVSLGVNEDLQQAAGFSSDPNADAGSASPFDVFVCRTATTFFALTSMVIGIMLSFKSSAAGAGIIINKAQSFQKWSKKKSREATGRYARRAERRLYKAGEEQENTRLGRGARAVRQTLRRVPVVGGAVGAAQGITAGRKEKINKEWQSIRGPGEGYNNWKGDALTKRLNYVNDPAEKAKILDVLGSRHPEDLAKYEESLSDKEKRKFKRQLDFNKRFFTDSNSNVYGVLPQYAGPTIDRDNMTPEAIEKAEEVRASEINKVIAKANNRQLANMPSDARKDSQVWKAMVDNGKNISNILQEVGTDLDKLKDFEEGLGEYAKKEFGPEFHESLRKDLMISKEDFEKDFDTLVKPGELIEHLAEKQRKRTLTPAEQNLKKTGEIPFVASYMNTVGFSPARRGQRLAEEIETPDYEDLLGRVTDEVVDEIKSQNAKDKSVQNKITREVLEKTLRDEHERLVPEKGGFTDKEIQDLSEHLLNEVRNRRKERGEETI